LLQPLRGEKTRQLIDKSRQFMAVSRVHGVDVIKRKRVVVDVDLVVHHLLLAGFEVDGKDFLAGLRSFFNSVGHCFSYLIMLNAGATPKVPGKVAGSEYFAPNPELDHGYAVTYGDILWPIATTEPS